LITDLHFYLVAIPAVLIYGMAKGGFGGGVVIVSVPLMALVISPIQAAAILLPILCVMDLLALWVFRGRWILGELRIVVPASLVGIVIGTLLFEYLSADVIRLVLGLIAIIFTLQYGWQRFHGRADMQRHFGPGIGVVAGTTAGFTSFVAHAGAPPLNMYLLRRGMDRTQFVATTAVFFAIANYVKLVPYAWLGQLDASNLMTSLVLAPLAPIGIATGKWLHDRVSDQFFFSFTYATLLIVGMKLAWDGLAAL
jgi:uncharacterized membrane protein YfcA